MREIVVFLTCLLLSVIGIIQGEAIKKSGVRHLFVQRNSPLPGTPRRLFESELHQNDDKTLSSADQNVHKLFSRVRRSLNPDMRLLINEVRDWDFWNISAICVSVHSNAMVR